MNIEECIEAHNLNALKRLVRKEEITQLHTQRALAITSFLIDTAEAGQAPLNFDKEKASMLAIIETLAREGGHYHGYDKKTVSGIPQEVMQAYSKGMESHKISGTRH